MSCLTWHPVIESILWNLFRYDHRLALLRGMGVKALCIQKSNITPWCIEPTKDIYNTQASRNIWWQWALPVKSNDNKLRNFWDEKVRWELLVVWKNNNNNASCWLVILKSSRSRIVSWFPVFIRVAKQTNKLMLYIYIHKP